MGILEYLRVDRPDCPGVVERAAPSGGARSCFEVAVTVPMSGPLSSTENAALETLEIKDGLGLMLLRTNVPFACGYTLTI